jgi:hypothetical protein
VAKQSDKKTVGDAQLAKLAKPLIAKDMTASAVIKSLRQAGYSFSGRRVRVMFTAKPAAKPATKATAKATAPAKGKAAAKLAKVQDKEARVRHKPLIAVAFKRRPYRGSPFI